MKDLAETKPQRRKPLTAEERQLVRDNHPILGGLMFDGPILVEDEDVAGYIRSLARIGIAASTAEISMDLSDDLAVLFEVIGGLADDIVAGRLRE